MKRKFVRGMAAGALMSAAVGIMVMPEMTPTTKKKFAKATSKVTDFTSNMWNRITDMRG